MYVSVFHFSFIIFSNFLLFLFVREIEWSLIKLKKDFMVTIPMHTINFDRGFRVILTTKNFPLPFQCLKSSNFLLLLRSLIHSVCAVKKKTQCTSYKRRLEREKNRLIHWEVKKSHRIERRRGILGKVWLLHQN